MNPWDLSSSGLLVWGIAIHLVIDWLGQNDWMAVNKAKRGRAWWHRHPAAFAHAGLHGFALAPLLGWPAALIALAHLLIDTRTPLVWWSKLIRQTQPTSEEVFPKGHPYSMGAPVYDDRWPALPLYDIGTEVRFWSDQSAHVLCLMIAALVVA